MNLYILQGKEEKQNSFGKMIQHQVRTYVIAESEEIAKTLVSFNVDDIRIEASTEKEQFPRQNLIIQK